MRRFELRDGGSQKFWEISLEGSGFSVRFGRIGTDGQAQTKTFASADKAKAEHDKLVAEKTKKGYVEKKVGGKGEPAKASSKGAATNGGGPIERLEAALAAQRPEYLRSLGKGATAAQLKRLEARVGARLPKSLVAFLSWRGAGTGRLHDNWGVMNIIEVLGAHEAITESLTHDELEGPSAWSPDWVPFLDNGGGDHLCVDLGGAFGGVPGQIIEFWHADTGRVILYPSFDAWLEVLVTTLEADAWKVTKDGFVKPDAKKLAKALAAACPGYPKKHDASEAPAKPAKAAKAATPQSSAASSTAKAASGKKPPVEPHPNGLPQGAAAPSKTTSFTMPKNAGYSGDTPYGAFSPDGARVAYGVGDKPAEPTRIVCDGVLGPEWTKVGWPWFSPTGILVHAARMGASAWWVNVGDRVFGSFKESPAVIFAGSNYAVAGTTAKKTALVGVNGDLRELPGVTTRHLALTKAGVLAFVVEVDKTRHIFVGDRLVEKLARKVDALAIREDGGSIAYVTNGPGFTLHVDGKVVGELAYSPRCLGFSPNGEVYWAAWNSFALGKHRDDDIKVDEIVFDDKGAFYAYRSDLDSWKDPKGKVLFKVPGHFAHAFHPKTRRFAFVVQEEKKGDNVYFVQIGTKRHGPYDFVYNLRFTDDGARVTFQEVDVKELRHHVVPAG